MSNPQSDRLDSLTRGTTGTSVTKPGLKFKPKAVARRTKEDRDASAPSIEVNTPTRGRGRGGARGGRGGARGGRGGKNLAGTHIVQAGPLASGNAVGESSGGQFKSSVRGVTPEYLSSLSRKSESRASSVALDSEDEEMDNLSKIDMSKEYKFDSKDVDLFPVRAPRSEHNSANDSGIKREPVSNADSRESSPEVLTEKLLQHKEESPVKDEESKDLQTLLKEKSNQLQDKLESLHIDANKLDDQFGALEDELRIKTDHKEILEKLTDLNDNKEKFLFVQLPLVLPEFESETSKNIAEEEPETTQTEQLKENITNNIQVKPEQPQTIPPQYKGLDGQIGHLRVHKSGKLTLKIGDVVMDVGKGTDTSFLQQVVLVDHGKQEKKNKTTTNDEDDMEVDGLSKNMKLIGHVAAKIDVIPRFD